MHDSKLRPHRGKRGLSIVLVVVLALAGCMISGKYQDRQNGDSGNHRESAQLPPGGSSSGGGLVLRPDYQSTASDNYAGSAACEPCHAGIYRRWRTTAHGRPFRRTGGDSPHSGSCARCHATAGEPVVGCESCHGPAASHARRPGPMPQECRICVISRRCIRCHTRPVDPGFQAKAGWKIVGHGKKK